MFIISSTIVLTCACLTRFRFVSFAPYSELSISRHRFNLLLFVCVLCHCISCHRLRLCNRASTTLHIVLLLRVYHFTLSQSLSLHRNMRRRCYANVTIKPTQWAKLNWELNTQSHVRCVHVELIVFVCTRTETQPVHETTTMLGQPQENNRIFAHKWRAKRVKAETIFGIRCREMCVCDAMMNESGKWT